MPPKRKQTETVTESAIKVNKNETSTSKTSTLQPTSERTDTASTHQQTSNNRITRASLKSSLKVKGRHSSVKSSTARVTRGLLRLSTTEYVPKQHPGWLTDEEEALLPCQVSGDRLTDACYKGQLEVVKNLLVSGADINKTTEDGWSSVMVAAYMGHKQLFDLLVKHGCDLTRKLENDNNILHLACLGRNCDVVHYIVSNKMADMESKGKHGRTALMKAAMVGEKGIFDLLLSRGSDLSSKDDYGNTILHLACFGDNVDIVQFILTRNIAGIDSVAERERTPVMFAAMSGSRKTFEFLVRKGCNLSGVDNRGNTILHLASCGCSVEIVQDLIMKHIVGINTKGQFGETPVFSAVSGGEKKVFDLLVREGCDLSVVDDFGDNILHIASIYDRADIAEYVITYDIASIDSKGEFGRTAVMMATMEGSEEVFDSLVNAGCDLSTVDDEGNTILHLACYFTDHVEIVQKVINTGAVGIDTRGEDGRTPVMFAAEKGRKNVFDMLVRKECDLTLADKYGNNILHLACMSNSVNIVEYLITHNIADIDSRGYKGKTPVMFAAEEDQKRVFDLLKSKGCDLSIVDDSGDKAEILPTKP